MVLPAIIGLDIIFGAFPRDIPFVSLLRNYFRVKRIRLSMLIPSFALFWGSVAKLWALRHRPSDDNLKVDALTWLLSVSASRETINDAVMALAGIPSGVWLQEALCDSGGYMLLAQGLFDLIKRSSGLVTILNEQLADAHLHALLHVVQRMQACRNLDSLANLVMPQGPLHRWDDLRPGLRIVAYCVQSFIKVLCNTSDNPDDCQEEIDILLEAGIQPYHWWPLTHAVVLRIDRGKEWEKAQGVALLQRLAQHSTGIAKWVEGPVVPDDFYSAFAEAGVVRSLCDLLSVNDTELAAGAIKALSELAEHGNVVVLKVAQTLMSFQILFVKS